MPKRKYKTLPSDYLADALDASEDEAWESPEAPPAATAVPPDYISALMGHRKARRRRPPRRPRKQRSEGPKARMTFSLPVDLCDRVRNTVWRLSEVEDLNLSRLAESALRREVRRLEKKYNSGEPLPPREPPQPEESAPPPPEIQTSGD